MPSALDVYVRRVDPAGTALAVSLVGEADIETAPVLRGCLLRLLNRHQSHLVLDLSRLEFIDSCGVSALLAGYHRAKQYSRLACAAALTSAVAKVFDLTALDAIIPTHPSVAEACQERFHLDQATVQEASIPIETFLMPRTPTEAANR